MKNRGHPNPNWYYSRFQKSTLCGEKANPRASTPLISQHIRKSELGRTAKSALPTLTSLFIGILEYFHKGSFIKKYERRNPRFIKDPPRGVVHPGIKTPSKYTRIIRIFLFLEKGTVISAPPACEADYHVFGEDVEVVEWKALYGSEKHKGEVCVCVRGREFNNFSPLPFPLELPWSILFRCMCVFLYVCLFVRHIVRACACAPVLQKYPVASCVVAGRRNVQKGIQPCFNSTVFGCSNELGRRASLQERYDRGSTEGADAVRTCCRIFSSSVCQELF